MVILKKNSKAAVNAAALSEENTKYAARSLTLATYSRPNEISGPNYSTQFNSTQLNKPVVFTESYRKLVSGIVTEYLPYVYVYSCSLTGMLACHMFVTFHFITCE